jgi:hypothetical protein
MALVQQEELSHDESIRVAVWARKKNRNKDKNKNKLKKKQQLNLQL